MKNTVALFLIIIFPFQGNLAAQSDTICSITRYDSIQIIKKALVVSLQYNALVENEIFEDGKISEEELEDEKYIYINSSGLPKGFTINMIPRFKRVKVFSFIDSIYDKKEFNFIEIKSMTCKSTGIVDLVLLSNYRRLRQNKVRSYIILSFYKSAQTGNWFYDIIASREG